MAESEIPSEMPCGNFSAITKYAKQDMLAGFLVFLIALPLCLGISMASGYPPIAGIFTAIIGSVVATFISNSELTIKGPAAGLIVIILGCIEDFGGNGILGGWEATDAAAYQAALAVGVSAAVLQIVFGIFRAGVLGEFFPSTVVHGMLAAIGVIIAVKQFPIVLGVSVHGEPLEMLVKTPWYVAEANPVIAAIGVVSLVIMFVWPILKKHLRVVGLLPAQVVVLAFAIPMGLAFNLKTSHSYQVQGYEYELGSQFLVQMPTRVFGMFDDLAWPTFSVLTQVKAWKWVMMFFIVGTLESLLSAKAVDLLDPWKRKSCMDRDVLAVGVGNLCASLIGGLPMISEIVRSKANIDGGACTRLANFWHGIFLLLCVAFIPAVLHLIPLAALAAMLVYTGYRLAHPTEFVSIYRIGREQLAIFLVTIVMVLATDLLIGVASGIALKLLIHMSNGVPLHSLFKPILEVQPVDETTSLVVARGSAVFSNWIPFRRQLVQLGLAQNKNLIIDVSDTKLIDCSVMEKLDELKRDFDRAQLTLEIRGLESLQPFSDVGHSTRKRVV